MPIPDGQRSKRLQQVVDTDGDGIKDSHWRVLTTQFASVSIQAGKPSVTDFQQLTGTTGQTQL